MSLNGTFKSMPAADLFQWLSLSRKTGTLKIENLPHRITFALTEGRVAWTSSDEPKALLGQFLLREGLITSTQLVSALELQSVSGLSTGKALVSIGALGEKMLSDAMRLKAQAEVHEALSSPQASFIFVEETTVGKELIPLDANVVSLLLNVMREIDEKARGAAGWDGADDSGSFVF